MDNSISVVIPTFNGANFIERALNSVWAQTRLPNEIVVSDDCSTDKTEAVVTAASKKSPVPIRFMRLLRNSGGPGRPLNAGITAASGQVILVLEQDDMMRPGRIEKQLTALGRFPTCSLVTGRFSIVGRAEGDMHPVWPVPQFAHVVDHIESQPDYFTLDPKLAFRELLNRQFAGGNSCYCFRKQSWRTLDGFNEEVRVCVDLDFALKAVLSGPVVVVNDFIMDYVLRPDSLWRRDEGNSALEVTLLRLKFASLKKEWAGDDFEALQATVRGFARAALQKREWASLARISPTLLAQTNLAEALGRKTQHFVAKRLKSSSAHSSNR